MGHYNNKHITLVSYYGRLHKLQKLKYMKLRLESWNKETFDDILEEKKKLNGKMKAIQQDVIIN